MIVSCGSILYYFVFRWIGTNKRKGNTMTQTLDGFNDKHLGGSLKTNSLLGTLMRRYVPEVSKETVNGKYQIATGDTGAKDCAWNKLTRIEQGEEWLRSTDKDSCPCSQAPKENEKRRYVQCENTKCCHHAEVQVDKKNQGVNRSPYASGIVFPQNIVLYGKYGSGKTTLAMQLAAACVEQGGISFVISFADTEETLRERYINSKHSKSGNISFHPCPLELEIGKMNLDMFIEWLTERMISFTSYSKKLIVFDSFNAKFNSSPTRHVIHELMYKLRENGIIGVFPLEDRQEEGSEVVRFINDVKFEADCVIKLEASADDGNEQTFIEIEKNRDFKPVLGKHLYKINEFKEGSKHCAQRYLKIFPHLHYAFPVYGEGMPIKRESKENNLLGDSIFDSLLPQRLVDDYFSSKPTKKTTKPTDRTRKAQIITLHGESGLYKSDIAINSLFYGLCDGENGLIVRLNDGEDLATHGALVSRAFFARKLKNQDITLVKNSGIKVEELVKTSEMSPAQLKYKLSGWDWTHVNPHVKDKTPKLVEMVFTRAAIQPEEWLDFVLSVIKKHDIQRVALVDLKFMGVSYKSLSHNVASGKMLLPTFMKAIKSIGVNAVICMSDDGLAEMRAETESASILSDASIKFSSDVSGSVKVTGSYEAGSKAKREIHLTDDDGGRGKIVIKTMDEKGKEIEIRHEHRMYVFN